MKKLTIRQRRIWWRITVATAVLIVAITFSPLILSPGKTGPWLFHMPFSLWTSLLMSVMMVVLTWIGGKLHLQDRNSGDQL